MDKRRRRAIRRTLGQLSDLITTNRDARYPVPARRVQRTITRAIKKAA
jgi:hypothetical protein